MGQAFLMPDDILVSLKHMTAILGYSTLLQKDTKNSERN